MDCKAIAAAGALRAAGLAPSRRDSRVSQDTRVSSSTQLGVGSAKDSARQLAQELALVHAVLEGFAAVDEYDWHFVVELPAQFCVAIHIHFLPGETTAARQFGEAFLDHFAQMTAPAGIDHDLAGLGHAAILTLPNQRLAREKGV